MNEPEQPPVADRIEVLAVETVAVESPATWEGYSSEVLHALHG